MKKINLLLVASAVLLLFGCEKHNGGDTPPLPPVYKTAGYYILGEGSLGSYNSTLYYYDIETGVLSESFTKANPEKELGGTANDMKIYGTKLYIAVGDNNKVTVLDATTGVIIKEIDMGKVDVAETPTDRYPRAVACATGKVFVSLYSGEVARIDTTTYAVDYTPFSGAFKYSEGIVTVDETTLYVANAGRGTGTTVSVVDIATFKVTHDITTPKNPAELSVNSTGDVYLLTMDVYDPVTYDFLAPSAFHKLNLSAENSTLIPNVNGERVAIYENTAYVTTSDWSTESSTLTKVNLSDNTITKMIENKAGSFNGVNINPLDGNIYVTNTIDWTGTSELLRFNEKGLELPSFAKVGYGPNTVAFVNKLTTVKYEGKNF